MISAILQRITSNQRVVAGQTAVQLVGKAVTVIGSFLVVRMIASVDGLGKVGYDDFALITGYVAYFYLALDFGFNTIFVQWATNESARKAEFFAKLLSLRVLLSAAMMVIGLAVLSFLPSHTYVPLVKLGIIFCLSTVLLQALFMTGNAYFQLSLRYELSVIVVVVAALLNLLLTYIVLTLGMGLMGVVVAFVAEYVLLAAGSVIMVRRYLDWRWMFDLATAKRYIIEALPLGTTILLTLLYFRSDQFLLSVLPLNAKLDMTNADAYGLYFMPYQMFDVFLTVPAFLMNAVYPLMLKAKLESLASLQGLMRKTLLLSAGISVILLIGIWALAPLAIYLQTDGNADFQPSVLVLRLLSIGLPAFFCTNVLVFTLISLGQKRWLPGVYVLAGIFNIAMNIWLIPNYGIVAAALSTVATEVVILLLLWLLVWSGFGQARRKEQVEGVALVD